MPRNSSSKTTGKSSARTARHVAAETDVLALLAEDHKKVRKLFDEFDKLTKEEEQDDEAKQMLVEAACAELTVHAQIEEEIFYPALRQAMEESDLLDEAEVEHAAARRLIDELNAMQPGDDLYDAKFTVLGEYVKHHVQEEEQEIFPKAKKRKAALDGMAEEIRQRKVELREELGLPSMEQEEEEEAMIQSPGKRKSVH